MPVCTALRGTDWLANPSNVSISLGDIKINAKDGGRVKTEAGTGYFKIMGIRGYQASDGKYHCDKTGIRSIMVSSLLELF